jgi:hypothetical protein
MKISEFNQRFSKYNVQITNNRGFYGFSTINLVLKQTWNKREGCLTESSVSPFKTSLVSMTSQEIVLQVSKRMFVITNENLESDLQNLENYLIEVNNNIKCIAK